jgi:hypothetical protein
MPKLLDEPLNVFMEIHETRQIEYKIESSGEDTWKVALNGYSRAWKGEVNKKEYDHLIKWLKSKGTDALKVKEVIREEDLFD